MVKKVLDGEFKNTSFVIVNPQGTKPLTNTGRSPRMAMTKGQSGTRGNGGRTDGIISEMNQIARQFRPNADLSSAELQDFHSLRQALNCASAEQRLLVFVNSPKQDRDAVEQKLKSVFSDEDIVGKFHLNFADEKADRNWRQVIKGATDKPSIMVVRSSQFGLDGDVLDQLSLDADAPAIKSSLLAANTNFANVEKRKKHEEHVQEGLRQGIVFENEIPRRGSDSPEKKKRGSGGRSR